MRHIILGLSLFIALPQQVKSVNSDFNHLYWAAVVLVGLYRLADSIYERSSQEKRKIDLFEESINAKIITSGIDPIKCLKTLQIVLQTNTAAVEKFAVLQQNKPSLQQQYYNIHQTSIELEREALNSLHSIQQLTNKQLQQLALMQQYNVTQEDLELLVALKQKNYQIIPRNNIDDVAKNYIKLEKKLSTQPA